MLIERVGGEDGYRPARNDVEEREEAKDDGPEEHEHAVERDVVVAPLQCGEDEDLHDCAGYTAECERVADLFRLYEGTVDGRR